MSYRTSEEPARRVATIRISRARSWWVGTTFGMLFVLGGLVATFAVSTSRRFICMRDESGRGRCTYEEKHVIGEHAQIWDLSTIEEARIEPRRFDDRRKARLVVVLDDGDHPIFDDLTKESTQKLRADTINEFIANQSRHEIDLGGDDDGFAFQWLCLAFAAFGALVMWGAGEKYPARRVVLDEVAGTARFGQRKWMTWYEEEAMPLGDVAAIERKIASYEPERDGAFVELKAFLR